MGNTTSEYTSQRQAASLPKKRKLYPGKIKSCLSRSKKKRKSKASRGVRFNDEAKTWDGPREAHILLERLVIDFWKAKPDVTIVNNLIGDENEQMLLELFDTLLSTIERIQTSIHMEGAHLIPGGGQNGVRLKPCNLAHLNQLVAYLRQSHDIVKGLKM